MTNDKLTPTSVFPTEKNTADVSLSDKDQLLADKINLRIGDAQTIHSAKVNESSKFLDLFNGNLSSADRENTLAQYKSKATVNRIYLTIRNMVGLSTDRPAIAFVEPSRNTEKSKTRAKKVEMALQEGMERISYQDLLALSLFDTWIKGDSYQHWFWDYTVNDFSLINIPIEDLMVSPEATDIQSAEYVIYSPKKSRSWWKKNYPKFYDKIKFEKLSSTNYNDEKDATSIGFSQRLVQYWENDLVISMVKGKEGDLILEKKKNPYYEYRTPEEQFAEWVKEVKPEAVEEATLAGVSLEELLPQELEVFKPITNFLTESKKPFVQIPGIKLQSNLYSTSLIGQLAEVFISMNKKKRQIADNLRGCNVKWIVDSSTFSGEEKAKITDEPNQVIEADFSTNPKPVYCAQPTTFEIDKVMLDIRHDEQYIDDVFGHHEISRGAGNAQTLGQDQLNFESDKTPIRQQIRSVESAIKQIWEGWIQLMKMYYTDKHYIKRFGAKGGLEMVELMNDEIEDGINPILKPASTVPLSKLAKAQESMSLWQAGAIDPYTLFSDLDKVDPEERANRLINWLNFRIISDENPNDVMADMQNQANTPGDITDNPIERADMENQSVQAGNEIPPTPPEYVTPEHVKLHYAFIKDVTKEMEPEDYDIILAHVEVDKATLARKISSMQIQQQVSKEKSLTDKE